MVLKNYTPDELKAEMTRRISAALPGAQIELEDVGGGNHWQARIVSSAFEGKLPLARQRLIFSALGNLMSGPVHALQMETLTPAQAVSASE